MRIMYYLLVALLGAGILLLVCLINGNQQIPEGEYYYSATLRVSYTAITASLFFLSGVAIGFYTRLKPFLAGFSIVLIFFVTAIYESIKYQGSHNLIPFEFVMYFIFALPAIIGVYVGRLIYNKRVVGRS